jgi:hypothetical protein
MLEGALAKLAEVCESLLGLYPRSYVLLHSVLVLDIRWASMIAREALGAQHLGIEHEGINIVVD